MDVQRENSLQSAQQKNSYMYFFFAESCFEYTLSNFSVCGWPKCPEKWFILEHTFYVGVLNFSFFLKKLHIFYIPKIEEFCWTFCQAQTLKLRRVNMVY